MAAPLATPLVAEEAPAAEAPAPAAAFEAPALAPAPVMEEAPEPSLFADLEAPEPEAVVAEAPALADDGLPAPAYQPRPEPVMEAAPAAGTPTPEAMARLQAAVGRAPVQDAPAATPVEGERPRFGINSLINRMTGAAGEAAAAPQPTRQQPQVTAIREEAEVDPDAERIEIPAFLRRQAN